VSIWSEKTFENFEDSKVEKKDTPTSNAQFGTSDDLNINHNFASPFPVGVLVRGQVSLDAPIMVDGTFQGQLFSASKVYISPSGVLEGILEAESFEIRGTVNGELLAREKIVVHQGAKIIGRLVTPILEVKAGANFNAFCQVNS